MASAKAIATKSSGPPKGMKPLVGGFAKTWDVEEFDTLQGKVGAAPKSVTLNKGTKKETDRRCVEVTTEDGERYTLWESAGLVPLFDAMAEQAPCKIWVKFTGLGTAKKGQNPPKLFDAAIG